MFIKNRGNPREAGELGGVGVGAWTVDRRIEYRDRPNIDTARRSNACASFCMNDTFPS